MQHYIELAYQQALKSPLDKRYGAVLIHRKKIVSVGHNYYSKISTSTKQCKL